MTDREILDEVYRRLGGTGELGETVRSFIEHERRHRTQKVSLAMAVLKSLKKSEKE